MSFRIKGLDSSPFRHLRGLTDVELRKHGASRVIADQSPGYPDRIELRDARAGESLLLLNYTHQPAANAYRASHAIYVLENAIDSFDAVDQVPPALRSRMISVRAFGHDDTIVNADLSPGMEVESCIDRLLDESNVAYLHLHYAKYGCFACQVDRLVEQSS